MTKNRAELARQRAGLSLGQAAKLIGCTREELMEIEISDAKVAILVPKLVDLYQVRVEWLLGECERYDYNAMKGIPGYDDLTGHDRDAIAEFAASMPRKATSS